MEDFSRAPGDTPAPPPNGGAWSAPPSPAAFPVRVRPDAFDFSGTTFFWHPDPQLSAIGNAVSFGAAAFEPVACRAVRDAADRVTDPALKRDCAAFIAQEAAHSAAHAGHLRALANAHPVLEPLAGETRALARELFSGADLRGRLAFTATVEAVLPAAGRHLVRDRALVLGGADRNVAALLLWHFCEEIEHEAVAVALWKAAYPARLRLWHLDLARRFAARFTALMREAFAPLFEEAGERAAGSDWVRHSSWLSLGQLGLAALRSPFPRRAESGSGGMPGWAVRYLDAAERCGSPVEALSLADGPQESGRA